MCKMVTWQGGVGKKVVRQSTSARGRSSGSVGAPEHAFVCRGKLILTPGLTFGCLSGAQTGARRGGVMPDLKWSARAIPGSEATALAKSVARRPPINAPATSPGRVSGRDKINSKLVISVGRKIDHFTDGRDFTATRGARLATPNVAAIGPAPGGVERYRLRLY